MGGMGIFRVGADGLNLGSIIETLNRDGAHDRDGAALPARDRRRATSASCVIGGKPVPYRLARIPQGSEMRGNLAAGGKGVAQPLSRARPRDRRGASARCWPRAACCWSAST